MTDSTAEPKVIDLSKLKTPNTGKTIKDFKIPKYMMTDDKALVKKSFETTYDIYKTLPNATICSMGMSGDFELAIECGSNMVRLGSVMFNK